MNRFHIFILKRKKKKDDGDCLIKSLNLLTCEHVNFKSGLLVLHAANVVDRSRARVYAANADGLGEDLLGCRHAAEVDTVHRSHFPRLLAAEAAANTVSQIAVNSES
jgi:hypothetical protein